MSTGLEVDPGLGQDMQALNAPAAGQGGATPAPTVPAPTPPASPAEGVKSDTPPEKVVSESVPYARFQEINEKARQLEGYVQQYERLLSPHAAAIVRDPVTGELRLPLPPPAPTQGGGVLTAEDRALFAPDGLANGFTDDHWAVFDHALQQFGERLEQRVLAAIDQRAGLQSDHERMWSQAQEEFPDLKEKGSELYRTADQIYREQYVAKGLTHPQHQYDAVLRASRQLERAKAQQEAAKAPVQQQNAFVGTKAKVGTRKTKLTPAEFERLSEADQEAYVEQSANFPPGGIGG